MVVSKCELSVIHSLILLKGLFHIIYSVVEVTYPFGNIQSSLLGGLNVLLEILVQPT